MLDACGGLLILLLAVALVVGTLNGLWVICRALFGGATGRETARPRRPQQPATPLSDQPETLWRDTARHLRQLHDRGLLSERMHRQMQSVLATERRKGEAAAAQKAASAELPDWSELQRELEPTATAGTEALDLEIPPVTSQVFSTRQEEPLEILEFDELPAKQKPVPSVEPEQVPPHRTRADRTPRLDAGEDDARQPVPAGPAQPPRTRDWGGLLQAFMEEKNIRWGELVSGMLIVGSAIGLVISLWSTLQQSIPYFPALLFMLGTASIHGAGVYTLRRWNLKSTSRGLLLISTLLIPLNFLAAIALSSGGGGEGPRPVTDPLYLVAVVVGLLSYGLIAYSSGRIFRKQLWWTMWPAVMLPSIGQLVISRQASPDVVSNVGILNLLALLPLVGFVAPMVVQLKLASRGERFSQRRATETFRLLGIGLFSLLMALGLLVAKTGGLRLTLAALAPTVSILAVMITAAGLLVHRRATNPALAATRTAGTTIALCGAGVMLTGLGLAWPRPELLVSVGVVDVVALLALAMSARLPALHMPAIAAAALTILTGVHWWQGALQAGPDASSRELIEALVMGRSSLVLLGVGLACVATMRVWRSAGRDEDAQSFQWGAAGLGGLSLAIAFHAGFISGRDAALTTPVFALAAAATLVVCRLGRQTWAAWAGAALTLVSLYHAFVLNAPVMAWLSSWQIAPRDPFVLSALLTGTIAAGFAFLVSRKSPEETDDSHQRSLHDTVIAPLVGAAFAASVFSIPQVLAAPPGSVAIHTGYLFWIAVLWASFAWILRSREAMLGTQAVSFIAVAYAAVAVSQRFPWWETNGFNDARYWQIQLGMQAVWCLLWGFGRQLAPVDSVVSTLLGRKRVGIDHFVLGGLTLATSILFISAVGPGVLAEFRAPTGVTIESTRGFPDALALILAVGVFAGVMFAAAFASFRRGVAAVFFGGMAAVVIAGAIIRNADHLTVVAHPDHVEMFGWTMWIVLALVAVGLVATLRERVTTAAICALVGLAGLVPLQLANQFGGETETASWLRWGLAAYAVVGFAGLMIWQKFQPALSSEESELDTPSVRREAATTVGVSVVLWPVVMLTMVAVALGFDAPAAMLRGDEVAEVFRGIGSSYATPLWVLAGVFVATAALKRRSDFTIAGSTLIQLGIVVMVLLPAWRGGGSLGGSGLIELLQWLGVGLGVSSVLWVAARRWLESDPAADVTADSPLGIQLLWSAVAVAILPLWAAIAIVASPDRFAPLITQIGDWKSFAALGTVAVASATALQGRRGLSWLSAIGGSTIALVPMVAAAVTQLKTSDPWLSYHTLIAGWGAAMVGFTIVAAVARWRSSAIPAVVSEYPGVSLVQQTMAWALPLGAVLVLLGIRAQWGDLHRPWWLVGAASAAALTTILFGLLQRRHVFAYVSCGLAMLATTAALSQPWIGLADPPTSATLLNVVQWNLIVISGIGLFWLAVQLFWQKRGEDFDSQLAVPAAHHTAAGFGLLTLSALAVSLLFGRASGDTELFMATPMGWGALAAIGGLLLGSLWDRRAAHAMPLLYLTGLVAAIIGMNSRDFSLRLTWYGIGLIGAGYPLATGLLWRLRPTLRAYATQAGIPDTQCRGVSTWLMPANVMLAALAVGIHFWVVLRFTAEPMLNLRLGAAFASAVLIPAMACLADDKYSRVLRFLSLAMGIVASVLCVWSLPQGDLVRFQFPVNATNALWLERMIRLLEVAAVATFAYAVGCWKLLDPRRGWGQTMRDVAVTAGGVGLVVLVIVLGMEGLLFPAKQVPVTIAQIVAVSVILLALAGGLIVLAVLPGRDPLRLTESGRMGYVYAAEFVASLLFLHIFLTKPVLFGRLRPYWPYIVIAIAYAGSGLSEWFRRKNLRVLSEPLRWTASFLPLLPALAIWTAIEQRSYDEFSLVLFLVGLAYVMLAIWRRSFAYALAAAFVGNMALWALMSHHGLQFIDRPQLWLIPPALSILVAGQLNRDRLTEAQLTALRYFCVTMIYVSSTGEMFIRGAGHPDNWWHPMLLATLSVAGILAGMAMRIRAYLYLGSSFLFLSLVSMVWHAARAIEHVWPWWVFGIVMGIAILALFGVFEKKRNEVLRVVGRLRDWER